MSDEITPERSDESGDPNRQATIGMWLCIVGVAVAVVALFLPMVDGSGDTGSLANNTLIQRSYWPVGVIGLLTLFDVFRKRPSRLGVLIGGGLIAALAILAITDHGGRTYYPVDGNGNPITTAVGTLEPPGIGIWLLCFAAGLILLSAVVMPGPWIRRRIAEDHAVAVERDDELLAAWDGVEINPDELDPITRRALKKAGRI